MEDRKKLCDQVKELEVVQNSASYAQCIASSLSYECIGLFGLVCVALLCTQAHGFGPCCTLSMGSGVAACLRPDLLLCLPFRAMDLSTFELYSLGTVLGCLVGEGSRQVRGVRTAS